MVLPDDLAAAALLSDPTRRRVYSSVVAAEEPSDRDAVAARAGISRKLAAFHLDRLADAGLLTTTYRRAGGRSGRGAGRPRKLYSQTRRELAVSIPPRDYGLMAGLFAEALEAGRSEGLEQAAEAAGRRIAKEAGPRRPASRRALVQLLARHGYQPAAGRRGIELRNCPFHALAASHRELTCAANHSLLAALISELGLSDLEAVSEPGPTDGRCCVRLDHAS